MRRFFVVVFFTQKRLSIVFCLRYCFIKWYGDQHSLKTITKYRTSTKIMSAENKRKTDRNGT